MDERIKKIADHYGLDSQLNILQEELAELIQAVSKYRRGDISHIIEEIVDVEIMLDQINYLLGLFIIVDCRRYDCKGKTVIRETKIRRQLKRIQEEAGNNDEQGSNQGE